jgi:hypothetical protein
MTSQLNCKLCPDVGKLPWRSLCQYVGTGGQEGRAFPNCDKHGVGEEPRPVAAVTYPPRSHVHREDRSQVVHCRCHLRSGCWMEGRYRHPFGHSIRDAGRRQYGTGALPGPGHTQGHQAPDRGEAPLPAGMGEETN